MTLWYLDNQHRLFQERQAIEDLERRCPRWMKGIKWGLGRPHLLLDVDIVAHDVTYEARLTYPDHYPAVLPSIAPRDGTSRWSSHQYGAGGPLCTEVGQDNWVPESMTAATLIESTYKLLNTENPQGDGPQGIVPSRHKTSLGQNLRTQSWRFIVTPELQRYLEELAALGAVGGKITTIETFYANTVVLRIWKIEIDGREIWTDPAYPAALADVAFTSDGLLRCIPTSRNIRTVQSVGALAQVVEEETGETSAELIANIRDCKSIMPAFLLVDVTAHPHVLVLASKESDGRPISCALVQCKSVALGGERRLPSEMSAIGSKRVGIIGGGSVGSKIAISLTRYGVRNFVLLDDDVLLAENLVRHGLDWRSVGLHKVQALALQLQLLDPDVNVDARCVTITGQEATTTSAASFSALAGCDIIVEATGDDESFNVLANLSRQSRLPMAWALVFAGGIGGLIARSRPGREPSPFRMRQQFLTWAKKNETGDFALPAALGPYEAASGGEIHVAGDAEVAVIAHHLVLLVVDTLLGREPSTYPYPMYLVGLRREWNFQEPFYTIPLGMDGLSPEEALPEPTKDMIEENKTFLYNLLDKIRDDDPPSSE